METQKEKGKKKRKTDRGSHDFCLFQRTSSGAGGKRDGSEGGRGVGHSSVERDQHQSPDSNVKPE